MVNLNRIFLVGNLTKDPELRYTPQGAAVTTLRLASNNSFKDKNGQVQKDTCFINVVVWGHSAEACNQYLKKGSSVFVEGSLQSRSWQDQEGKNRTTIEVRAARVQFMPKSAAADAKQTDPGVEPQEVVNLNDGGENADII